MNTPINSLGTGTWNDEEYMILQPASTGPNLPVARGRDHLRFPIADAAEYTRLKEAIAATNYGAVAAGIRRFDTGEPSDVWLKQIADDLDANGTTPWTVCVYTDKKQGAALSYFFEVSKWR